MAGAPAKPLRIINLTEKSKPKLTPPMAVMIQSISSSSTEQFTNRLEVVDAIAHDLDH